MSLGEAPEDVQQWLVDNEFNEATRELLDGFDRADLFELSKDDFKDIVGLKAGIRLFNRVQRVKSKHQEEEQPASAAAAAAAAAAPGPDGNDNAESAQNSEESSDQSSDQSSDRSDDDDDDSVDEHKEDMASDSDQQPSSSVKNVPTDPKDLVAFMERGCDATVYTEKEESGRVAKLLVRHLKVGKLSLFLRGGKLHWCQAGDRAISDDSCIKVRRIRDVIQGALPTVFELFGQANVETERCLSICSSRKTLNLEFAKKSDALAWGAGLRHLLGEHGAEVLADTFGAQDAQGKEATFLRTTAITNCKLHVRRAKADKHAPRHGWIQVQGKKGWSTRYAFVRPNGDSLDTWRHQPTAKLPFRAMQSLRLFGSAVFRVPEDNAGGKRFAMGVREAGSKKPLLLHANTDEEREAWLSHLAAVAHTEVQDGSGEGSDNGWTKRPEPFGDSPLEAFVELSQSKPKPGEGGRKKGGMLKRLSFVVGGLAGRRWNKRFAQLQGSELVCFELKSGPAEGDSPTLLFRRDTALVLAGAECSAEPASEGPAGATVLRVKPNGARVVFSLRLGSEEERDSWLKALKKACEAAGDAPAGGNGRCLKEGFLKKAGKRKGGGFKERWFRLSHDRLRYFKSSTDKKPQGEIPLSQGAKLAKAKDLDYMRENTFTVAPSDGDRVFVLCASSAKLRDDWMEAIQLALDKLSMWL